MMNVIRLGWAFTGSFCTFAPALQAMEQCAALGYEILPIFSYHAATIDTRFGKAADFIRRAEEISGHTAILTIDGAEPLGPKQMTDLMLVAPCTGNTLAKLAYSITDTPVTMAVKSHLRQQKPVVLALATNDALAGSAKNFGQLLSVKHYRFVPLWQDAPMEKPTSLVCDFSKIPETLEAALQDRQLQPLLLEK